MSAHLDIRDVVALGVQLSESGPRVGAAAATALRRTAYAIESDAVALAPVDTGNLRGSISTSFEGDGRFGSMTAEIGPTAEYGIYVELGTSRMAGQPYMTPAADRRIPEYENAISKIAAAVL